MTLVAWILLIPFGIIALQLLSGFIFNGSLNLTSAIYMAISIIITALCAGYLWGGLDKFL